MKRFNCIDERNGFMLHNRWTFNEDLYRKTPIWPYLSAMKSLKKTLVLGASTHPYRYSYLAIHKLRKSGHPVVAIGKKIGKVKDVEIQSEAILFEDVDTVTLYLNPRLQELYYEYVVALHPKRVVFNPGTENPDFYQILEAEGIAYEVACTLVLLGTNQY